jgi:hypothetical protein
MLFAFFFALDVFFDNKCDTSQGKDEGKNAIGNGFFGCLRKPVASEVFIADIRVSKRNEENKVWHNKNPLIIECGFTDSVDIETLLHHLVGFVEWLHFVKAFAGQVSRLKNKGLEFFRRAL